MNADLGFGLSLMHLYPALLTLVTPGKFALTVGFNCGLQYPVTPWQGNSLQPWSNFELWLQSMQVKASMKNSSQCKTVAISH